MAITTKRKILPVTEEDLEGLRTILQDLKAKAREARDKGNLTVFTACQRCIKSVSFEVTRLGMRQEREELATINKAREAMRQKFIEDANKGPQP